MDGEEERAAAYAAYLRKWEVVDANAIEANTIEAAEKDKPVGWLTLDETLALRRLLRLTSPSRDAYLRVPLTRKELSTLVGILERLNACNAEQLTEIRALIAGRG